MDYNFLSRSHYTKSKNYFKRQYRILTEFPCLVGHPVDLKIKVCKISKVSTSGCKHKVSVWDKVTSYQFLLKKLHLI